MELAELINKIENKKTVDEEWFEIREEVIKFLNEDHPEEEKKVFRPLGYLEVVTMMCDGLERMKKEQK